MTITLQNKHGKFEMGGGSHPNARIYAVKGFGLPAKEVKTVAFEDSAGVVTTHTKDKQRVVTISFDMDSDVKTVENLYKIIYEPCEILCRFGSKRYKIVGRCNNPTEIEHIIFRRMGNIALQFECDDPYFHDFAPVKKQIAEPIDKLPNLLEGSIWYVSLPSVATERNNRITVNNTGHIAIYPIITLTNQNTVFDNVTTHDITITNTTTSKTIKFSYNIASDEMVTIDLPNRKIISDKNGNITGKITNDTVLSDFYLQVGENVISVASENINDVLLGEIEFTNNYVMAVM